MAVLSKTGVFTNPLTTGNFDVTGLGFQPTGIIVYQEQGPDTAAMGINMGFADAALNQIMVATIATGRAGAQSRRSTTNKIISRPGTTGITQVEGNLVTMLADGFRINFTTVTNAYTWRYIAFKDVPIKVGYLTASATNATGSVTGMAFKPQAMVGMWMPSSNNASSAFGHGFVDQSLTQFSSVGNNDSGTGSIYASEPAFVSIYESSVFAGRMNVTALNSNGFSYSTTGTGAAFDYAYFAIGGVQSKLVDVTAELATPGVGGPVSYSTVGFKPQSLFNSVIVNNLALPANPFTSTWGPAVNFGIADDTLGQAFQSTVGLNGTANTKARYFDATRAFGRTSFGSPAATPYVQAELTSYDTNGFTLNWSLNSDAANIIWKTLALAPAPVETTKTQTGSASVLRTEDRIQLANTRILRVEPRTQIGNTRITATTPRTMVGNTRIQKSVLRTTTGTARVTASASRTITSNARIAIPMTKNQTGAALIREAEFQRTYGDARIEKPQSRNQTANASVLRSVTVSTIGISRIQRSELRSQLGTARIGKNVSQTTTGRARIANTYLKVQPAEAAVLRRPEIPQPATAIIAKAVDAVITGGAFIIRVNDYINVPRIGISPQIGGQPGMVDGRGVTDINVAKSRTGRVAERPRTSVVNTRPRTRQ